MDAMTLLLWLAALLMVLTGLAGIVLPALPGVVLVFGGLWLAAWLQHYQEVSGFTVAVLGAMAVLATAVDLVAGVLGARRVGASPAAIAGSAIGTVAGLFFGFAGLLLGPFAGAVIGEMATHGRADRAAAVGFATWMGLLFGTLLKLALSLAMIGVFALAWIF